MEKDGLMVFSDPIFKEKFFGDKKYFAREFILDQIKHKGGLTQELYERALNGLEYLSQLIDMGLDPIFKGGSAVQLLIPENIQRLSIDIDLMIDSSENEITSVLELIHKKFDQKFYNFGLVRNKDLPPHLILYNVYIPSLFYTNPSKIELDILLHKPNYKIQQTPLKTFIYKSKFTVKTPTIDALMGDKLTVICPTTIGKEMKKPLDFAKQLYDVSILLDYSKNFGEILDAYFDVFNFEKKSRILPELTFKNAIYDLINTCKLYSLIAHLPEEIQDADIIARSIFLKNGITGLTMYTSRSLKLGFLKTRTISAKIAFLAKLMQLKFEANLPKPISMEIFHQENPKVKELIRDKNIINKIIEKLESLEIKERYHLQFKEIKKVDPIGLLFWFGCYFPVELLQLFE